MAGNPTVGQYVGTGSAVDVTIGWVPDVILLFNVTDGNLAGVWFNGMTDGTAIDIAAAVTLNVANGISVLLRNDIPAGFTAGTDFSVSGKTYRYLAIKTDQ